MVAQWIAPVVGAGLNWLAGRDASKAQTAANEANIAAAAANG